MLCTYVCVHISRYLDPTLKNQIFFNEIEFTLFSIPCLFFSSLKKKLSTLLLGFPISRNVRTREKILSVYTYTHGRVNTLTHTRKRTHP